MMEQFFHVNYVGHSQSIPQESKLATYAAVSYSYGTNEFRIL